MGPRERGRRPLIEGYDSLDGRLPLELSRTGVYVSPRRIGKSDPRSGPSVATIERQLSPFAIALWPPDGICPPDIDAELNTRSARRPAPGSTCKPLPRFLSKPPKSRSTYWSDPRRDA